MKYTPFILYSLLLAGCSASVKYDIDVECWRGVGAMQEDYKDEQTKTFQCAGPQWFEIQCNSKTIQIVNDSYLCTTHDGKSVRIKKTEAKIK